MGFMQRLRQALLGEAAERPASERPSASTARTGTAAQTARNPQTQQQRSARPAQSMKPAQSAKSTKTAQPDRTAQTASPTQSKQPTQVRSTPARQGAQSQRPARRNTPQTQQHGNEALPSLDLVGRRYGAERRDDSSRLAPQPLLDAGTIAKARSAIGPIEKNELSDEQISAIAGAAHNTLVLAGAGTGKTTTIVGYIAWLLKTGKAKPNEILVLSFTRKSADEMSGRIQAQTGEAIRACTFHSLGLEICRNSTIANRPIIDENTANKAIGSAFGQLLATSIPYRLLAFKLMPRHLLEKYGAAARTEAFRMPEKDYEFNQYAQHLVDTAKTIIQQMRSNNIDVNGMRALNRRYGGTHAGRNAEMLDLIEPLYRAYMDCFHANNGIDFPGMIIDAIDCVKTGKYRHEYRYVLIDEYQDMSRPRYELIRAMREQRDFSLFCVGDDWQSIYRFAGSDIGLILDFDKLWSAWGKTRMFQITTTRRFRASLIEASGAFVMSDPSLYVKHLHSTNEKKDYSLKALGGKTPEERFTVIVEQLRKLPKKASVLLLGRYHSDLNLITKYDREGLFRCERDRITFLEKPEMTIEFMTAHKSKGLQRDFVFLLCCSGGLKGFPSAIPEEPLLGLLLPEVERYPYAEERRLFYVAMTRCRKKVFFVVDQARPSKFMYELHDHICPNIFRGVTLPPQCPMCGSALAERHPRNNPDRAFYGCTGYPACNYIRNIR